MRYSRGPSAVVRQWLGTTQHSLDGCAELHGRRDLLEMKLEEWEMMTAFSVRNWGGGEGRMAQRLEQHLFSESNGLWTMCPKGSSSLGSLGKPGSFKASSTGHSAIC